MPTAKTLTDILEEFDQSFVNTEGCQADHEDGKCLHCEQSPCPHCVRWNGKSGEYKYHKPPTASANDIREFVRQAYLSGLMRAEEVLPEDHGLNTTFATDHPETARIQGKLEGYNHGLAQARSAIRAEIDGAEPK
jgi:hypothetical protein